MQPRTLLILLLVLPIFTVNAVYLLSAAAGMVPWCMPYIDGCTTISRAARSGNSIFLFRVTMIAYALLLIGFWIYVKHWLAILREAEPGLSRLITWLGIVGALAMMVYVNFLGTEGEVNRFMRRHGIMLFFLFTPLAQMLLYREHQRLIRGKSPGISNALRMQFVVLLLMLLTGLASLVIDLLGMKSYESQNIVEWNFALLMNLYFIGMFSLWRDFRIRFSQ